MIIILRYAYSTYCIKNNRFSEARTYINKAANNGLAEACFQLGIFCKTGNEIEFKDPEKSFKYILIAHEKGIVEATFTLAVFFSAGFGTQVDEAQSLKLYEEATKKGIIRKEFLIERFSGSAA